MNDLKEIRDGIEIIAAEVRECDVIPSRAAFLAARLSGYYASILEVITQRLMAYNRILSDQQIAEQAAARAKVRAQATPEYESLVTAQNLEKSTLQLIQALKVLAKVKAEEFRSLGA